MQLWRMLGRFAVIGSMVVISVGVRLATQDAMARERPRARNFGLGGVQQVRFETRLASPGCAACHAPSNQSGS